MKKYSAEALRFFSLSNHYRSPLDYSDANNQATIQALNSVKEFIAKLDLVASYRNRLSAPTSQAALLMSKADASFDASLADDFNTPEALATIFNFINDANKFLWTIGSNESKMIKKWLIGKFIVFGIKLSAPKIPAKISKLAGQRELFRTNKQFAQGDALRKELDALGYKVEDTPVGPLVLKNQISNFKSQN